MSEQPKDVIRRILNLRSSDDKKWKIVDKNESYGLYMIHYTASADLRDPINLKINSDTNQNITWGYYRGIVIDINEEKVVCGSEGYTTTVYSDKIVPNNTGNIILNDVNKVFYNVNVSNALFKVGHEGIVLRIFWYKEKLWIISHKKLDISRSTWGKSITFLQMFDGLTNTIGWKPDSLFKTVESKKQSVCHSFIMVHPDLLVGSKQDVGAGYLVYLGARATGNKIDNNHVNFPPVESFTINDFKVDKPKILESRHLTILEANIFLQYGFYQYLPDTDNNSRIQYSDSNDIRHETGEFIIMSKIVNGIEIPVAKIQSTSYTWRTEQVRMGNPNIYNQLFILFEDMFNEKPIELKRFVNKFPLIDLDSFNEEDLPIVRWKNKNNVSIKDISNPEMSEIKDNFERDAKSFIKGSSNRSYTIFINLLLSVPLHRQIEVADMRSLFFREIEELINWIGDLFTDENVMENENINGYVKNAMEIIRKRSDQTIEKDKIKNVEAVLDSLQYHTRPYIYRIPIGVEFDDTPIPMKNIYKMIRNMKMVKSSEI